jgi:hypothetical protein
MSALAAYGSVLHAALRPYRGMDHLAGIPNLDQTQVGQFHPHRDVTIQYFDEKADPESHLHAILCLRTKHRDRS